jgi:threonine/homoserine/homoserine lactone efflux protein
MHWSCCLVHDLASVKLPLVLGIAFGVAVQLFAIGIGLNQVFLALPQLQFILSLIGTAYILWLAWKIASSGPLNIELEQNHRWVFYKGLFFSGSIPKRGLSPSAPLPLILL